MSISHIVFINGEGRGGPRYAEAGPSANPRASILPGHGGILTLVFMWMVNGETSKSSKICDFSGSYLVTDPGEGGH